MHAGHSRYWGNIARTSANFLMKIYNILIRLIIFSQFFDRGVYFFTVNIIQISILRTIGREEKPEFGYVDPGSPADA